MLHFFAEYGLFLLKTITLVLALLILLAGVLGLSTRSKKKSKDKIEVKKLNDRFSDLKETLEETILDKADFKKQQKTLKKEKKEQNKQKTAKKRLFVLNFNGDIKASAVHSLRDEITAILTVATPEDEIVLILESPGGVVPFYGLAASQLDRIKQKNIPLTVCVDKVAASGGYLMACVANKILAAPFAIIGSIGVVAQIPNFHRLLKKNNIDFEQITAGEFKRTLTMFGENTEKARDKLQAEVEVIHDYFKDFIRIHRPHVNVEEIATGEHWLASNAKKFNLVDELITSDDYLFSHKDTSEIYQVAFSGKKTLGEKISEMFYGIIYKNNLI